MLKVALIDPSLFTLAYDAALARALTVRGVEVRLWGRPLRPGEQVDLGGAVFEPRFFGRQERLPGPVRRLAKAAGLHGAWRGVLPGIAGWRPDIIHLQWLAAPLLDGLWLRRLRRVAPVVVTVHDAAPFQGSAPAVQRLGWFRALAAADLRIVHHACTEDALRRAGVSGPVERSHHGPLPARRRGEVEPGLLVQFGAVKPYKGHDVALRALQRLPDHRLLIAGPAGPGAGRLPILAARLGVAERVVFRMDFIPEVDLDPLLSRAHAFLFPYRRSDASGALWRVAELGRPVVASAVGGLAEDLVQGETAALVPPDDPVALAAALRELDPALGVRLAEEARRRPWSLAADAHLRAYRGLLEGGDPKRGTDGRGGERR